MGRGRRKAKAATQGDTKHNVTPAAVKPNFSNRDECRSMPQPMVIDYKHEATRAWKAYVTLVADIYMKKLDHELHDLSACDWPAPRSLLGLASHQKDVMLKMEAAKKQYLSNLSLLEAGEPFSSIPLIDPDMTLEAIEKSVSEECTIDLNISQTPYCESRQSSESRNSLDSAMHEMDEGVESSGSTGNSEPQAHSEMYADELFPSSDEEFEGQLPLTVAATTDEENEKILDLLKPMEEKPVEPSLSDPCVVAYKCYTGVSDPAPTLHSQYMSVGPITVTPINHAPPVTASSTVSTVASGEKLSQAATTVTPSLPSDVDYKPKPEPGSWSQIAATAEGEEWTLKTPRRRARTVSQSEDQLLNQSNLCLDYLNTKACRFGNECRYDHVYDPQLTIKKSQATTVKSTPSVKVPAEVPPSTPMDNALFQGEEGQKRRKVTMCRAFKRGECHWGVQCNYAHSDEELRAAHKKLEKSNKVDVKLELEAAEVSAVPKQGKLLMCKSYELKLCKRAASECKYAHHRDELDQAFNHKEPCRRQQCPGRLRYEKRKTIMCPDYMKNVKCIFGDDCHYAHSLTEIRPLPKHEICSRFGGGAMCVRASECVYAHSKKELRPASPVRTKTVPAAGAANTANSNTKVAAAINSAKVVVNKTKEGVHPEPCSRQHCPDRLRYETRHTKLCTSVNKRTVCVTPNCNDAHSMSELKPLPKYEMCSKFGGTKLCMPAFQCPYAHTKGEQRVKPLKTAVSSTNNKPSEAKAKLPAAPKQKPAVTASSHRHTEQGASSSEDDECLICFSKVDEKIALDCGHNRFHFWCISKWLNEGRPNCPCCNHPAILPDLFKAPAGLKPSDFPSLGL